MKDAIEVQREKTILALLKAIEDLALQIKKGLHEPGQTASAAYDLARACAEIDLASEEEYDDEETELH